MKKDLAASLLAVVGGASALLLPATGQAGNVGHYNNCGWNGSPVAAITAAGHTAVPIATLNAASLAPLDGLVITTCNIVLPANIDLNNAVAGGMALVYDNASGYETPSANLPGAPIFTPSFACPSDINVPATAPIASGPGGTLTNSSFDRGLGTCALVGKIPAEQLPTGAVPFLTESDPNAVGAFGYLHGSGRVAYSISQFMATLPDSNQNVIGAWAPAASIYYTNALAWTLAGLVTPTTCASEGYTGTKLTWCRNICENGLTGATLDMWIHRWVNRYRDLPYCAVEGGEEPPPPPQEG